MKFYKDDSELYIYNNACESDAFKATTHLGISAHQDDIEFMAYHGILQCFRKSGSAFSAVVVTNGSGSPRASVYKDCKDEQMIQIRKAEQKKAAMIGEYATLSMLMYPSSEVKDSKNHNLINDLYNILLLSKPEIVYTHNLADKHDTHVSVALRVLSAIRRLPLCDRPKKLYGCEVWRGLDWLNDDVKVMLDVGGKQNLAEALMGVFDSQISGGKQYGLATTGRRIANATYADDHAVDTFTHVTYALDMTSLITDDSISPIEFISQHIQDFYSDVISKLTKFS